MAGAPLKTVYGFGLAVGAATVVGSVIGAARIIKNEDTSHDPENSGKSSTRSESLSVNSWFLNLHESQSTKIARSVTL